MRLFIFISLLFLAFPCQAQIKEYQHLYDINPDEEIPMLWRLQKEVHKGGHHVKLMELDSHTCRWPLGDPRDEDFCFCGKKVRMGQTYCEEHANMAYVKATKK